MCHPGVGFSTLMAGILSMFICITGTGIDHDGDTFTVSDLTDTLKRTEGAMAGLCFGAGMYAAAFSSALTVALGASLTLQSLVGRPAKLEMPRTSPTASPAASPRPSLEPLPGLPRGKDNGQGTAWRGDEGEEKKGHGELGGEAGS